MTRPRRHALVALLLIASVVAIAGCGDEGHTRATSAATDTTTTGHAPGDDPTAAAHQFAAAYVRVLDGVAPPAGLPDTTSGVRALAGQAGPVPAARRRGPLVLAQLQPARGQAGSYLLAARDQAHTFYATITLRQQEGRWVVTGLTPPDIEQTLAPAGPAPPAAPPGSSAPRTAARAFLAGYLPWLYGRGSLRTVPNTTARLLANLALRPPRIPPSTRSLQPAVVAIAVHRRDRGWRALSSITDGRETYQLDLTITHTHGTWLVSRVSGP